MFADVQSWFGNQLFWLVIIIYGWVWIFKRYAGDKVKGAAKEAVTNHAVNWINRLGKR
jgi:hypothetical protein